MNPYNTGNKGLFKLVFYQRRSVLVSHNVLKRDKYNSEVLQVQGKKRKKEREKEREKEQEKEKKLDLPGYLLL